jgi:asparagine N-glycosylation enzyme membrane subunit Stt3
VSFSLVALAVLSISYALEGYLPRLGILRKRVRVILFFGGLCLGFPWLWIRIAGMLALAGALILGFTFQKNANPTSTQHNATMVE